MKVLWLCNLMPPVIAEALKLPASNKEGWISGLLAEWKRHREESGIELGICFPLTPGSLPNKMPPKGDIPITGEVEGISFYGFFEDTVRPERYDADLEKQLTNILKSFVPDLVHVFGTEYPHALAMAKCIDSRRLLVGIQGLCSRIADCYGAGLPGWVQKRFLLRDLLKRDNIAGQQKKFLRRGKMEIQCLQLASYITGRTAWDRAAVKEINPGAEYYEMNETLRPDFYEARWDREKCEAYSIFLSQGNYPLKGLHLLIKALPRIKEQYPQVKVYVAGDVITRYETLKNKLKIGSYGQYCRKLIHKYKLENTVCFVGPLSSLKMRDRYLQSHVFLSASVLENSSNSVGEAMLLGMPVVSSDVGGIASLLTDKREGLLYPCMDEKALAEAVCRMFGEDDFAMECAKRARERALKTHDSESNYNRLLEIYNTLL
ncbi:MAG: glycosyltransferase family 4 protein [Lachnospiraceae bacterium]|nr:glycosyltransferase family 4 protein [Lachnospiraceae bacterium]